VRDLETKLYLEQEEIYLAERAKVVEYYNKKIEEDRSRIMRMDLSEQAKYVQISEKEMKTLELRDRDLTDIDSKIEKFMKASRAQQAMPSSSSSLDRKYVDQTLRGLEDKVVRVREEQEKLRRENLFLK
jgi:hypothetical protein